MEATNMFCSKCGEQNDEGSIYCFKCGSKLKQQEHISTVNEEKTNNQTNYIPSKKSEKESKPETQKQVDRLFKNKVLWAIVLFFVFSVVLLAALNILKGYGTNSKYIASAVVSLNNSNSDVSNDGQVKSDKIDQLSGKEKWLVEPCVEAEDINVLECSRAKYYSLGRVHIQDKVCTVKINGKYGLIDYDGNIVINPEFEFISIGYENRYLLSNNSGDYTIDNDYSLVQIENGLYISGTAPGDDLLWSTSDQKIVKMSGDGDVEYCLDTLELAGVRSTNLSLSSSVETNSFENNDLYALAKTDKLFTEFVFEDFSSASEGLIGMKHNGKWGYYDLNGKLVIPHEYDASWYEEEYMPPIYAQSNGYTVLCKDGKYGLADSQGSIVIDFGKYEELRPVYKGRMWAKYNGMWGVLFVGKNDTYVPVGKDEKFAPSSALIGEWNRGDGTILCISKNQINDNRYIIDGVYENEVSFNEYDAAGEIINRFYVHFIDNDTFEMYYYDENYNKNFLRTYSRV